MSLIPPYPEDTCPRCNEKAVSGCRCPMRNGTSNDRSCPNGHRWHWKDGKKVVGSHHKKEGNMNFGIDYTKLAETLKASGLIGNQTSQSSGIGDSAQDKYSCPTRGHMHRCRFCWPEVDKTDNGFKPLDKPYPHAKGCPHSGKF